MLYKNLRIAFLLVFSSFIGATLSAQQLSVQDLMKVQSLEGMEAKVLFLKGKDYDMGIVMEETSDFKSAEFRHKHSTKSQRYKLSLSFFGEELSTITHDVSICDGAPSKTIEHYKTELIALGYSLDKTLIQNATSSHFMYVYKKGDWIMTISSMLMKDPLRCEGKASNVVLMLSKGEPKF